MNKIKQILEIDRFVSSRRAENELRNQQGIALIAAAAFVVMSILNVKQHSLVMLATTSLSALALLAGYFICKYQKDNTFLRVVFYTIFIVVFTAYTILGGNDGFAILWIIIATYAVMICVDFRGGFFVSLYYLVMLLLLFTGPLSGLLQYAYNETFMLRFPFLYATSFAFATYIMTRIRTYQYQLLLKQEELEQLSTTDLSTGLMNRNRFVQYRREFQAEETQTLLAVFIDVNGLHAINNSKGHSAGDAMLLLIAGLCREQFPCDSVFRMGGDEFLILCKNAKEEQVVAAAQTLFDAVVREGYSISYGIARQDGAFDLDELVKSADAEMIQSKRAYYARAGQTNRL